MINLWESYHFAALKAERLWNYTEENEILFQHCEEQNDTSCQNLSQCHAYQLQIIWHHSGHGLFEIMG